MQNQRIEKIKQQLQKNDLHAVVINPGPSLTYLTGLNFHLSERPTVLIVKPKENSIVLPRLESLKLNDSSIELTPYLYGDDPSEWQSVFSAAVSGSKLTNSRIGVEPTQMRYLELQYLQAANGSNQFVSAANIFANLRVSKDDEEIASIRKAAVIAQEALTDTLKSLKLGMTEVEIAAVLTIQLLKHGSQPELPFQPIVASGPNSANPHAAPTDRKLQAGDFLLFDYGARFNGYCSDITRTFGIGHLSSDQIRVYETVLAANNAGRIASKTGVSAESVDKAARAVTEKAGLAEFFTHRTGHGLGMETHEAPYIYTGNPQILEDGMVHTVEPGLYLPELGGVRIEDDMVVRPDASESLTDFPRDLSVLELG